jgi:Tol biopolymer transport system component
MGEVYRARDPRLGRDVAIKVLPAAFSENKERLRRFEQEAQAAGALNHPNILAIYDVDTYEGAPYVVSELLEGETLRERMHGTALSTRKAIEYAVQLARGLAAAHDKGIVHRDIKPENIFITRDGHLKILDFGLAKLTHRDEIAEVATNAPTLHASTDPGVVVGTAGYMSPEQVRARPLDHRSDIFSFGAVLYEMLSGRWAFRGESAVETMNAILTEDPPDLSETNKNIPPALERVVRHCLEKNPQERFQSSRDLAFDLDSLSGIESQSAISTSVAEVRKKRISRTLLAAAAILIAMLGTFLVGRRLGVMQAEKAPPAYRQLVFRRGTIQGARFAPDGDTVIYDAAWEGKPGHLFSNRPESPESRPYDIPEAKILAVSSTGEMAIMLGHRSVGTLARVPLAGGAPREVVENVKWADWAPDGKNLAIVRAAGGRDNLEFPIGKILYETNGWISNPRFSRKGDLIAFIDHPSPTDDAGSIAVVDLAGKKRTLTSGFATAYGLAWNKNADEIWFSGAEMGSNRGLYAVTTGGEKRLLARVPGSIFICDTYGGRALVIRSIDRMSITAFAPGDTEEKDLSWLDLTEAMDLSDDGKNLVFSEVGEGGGATYGVYLRKTDGSPAVRLGDGDAQALSPDGKWVLGIHLSAPARLDLLPTGAGQPRDLKNPGIEHYHLANWFPDGKHVLFAGDEAGHGMRLYIQDIEGGDPRAFSPEGVDLIRGSRSVSPDGKTVFGFGPDGKVSLYPVDGGPARAIPGLAEADRPIRWSGDGRFLYVAERQGVSANVQRLDLSTGRKDPWKALTPADPAGVLSVKPVQITPDGKYYAYSYFRALNDLYIVDGLK